MTEATLQYASTLTTKKRAYKKPEPQFETTQHDYGQKIVFERTYRSPTGEIESLNPADEKVYEMPPPGITVKNPQDTVREIRERNYGDTDMSATKKKSFARVSYFTMRPEEYTGSKWKDF